MAKKTKINSEASSPKSKITPKQQTQQNSKPVVAKVVKPVPEEPLSPIVERAMKLNPHMKTMWITQRGFVHQATAPEYLRKDAKFYVNKYFNK